MKLCVFGMGYIGLPTAAMFANRGFDVLGLDVDPDRIMAIKNGSFNINEPGLKAFLRDSLNTGNLRVSNEPEPRDVYIICVPTPLTVDRRPDISSVESAGREISRVLGKGEMVILESTVPPGTTENTLKPILEASGLEAGKDFSLCYCPERVMPGNILKELTENHRIIGGMDPRGTARAKELYGSFVEGNIYTTDTTTAEFTKLAENTYRDVNIALANEFAKLCELHGTDVWKMRDLANNHPRVDILKPGPGVGGHCLPVDPWFLVNGDSGLISKSREINDGMVRHVEGLIRQYTPDGGTVVLLGTAYKANTEDERCSPTLDLLGSLGDFKVRLHDPWVDGREGDLYQLLKGAHTLVLMVDHGVYRSLLSPQIALEAMAGNTVIDTRNFFDRHLWEAVGWEYVLLGVNDKI